MIKYTSNRSDFKHKYEDFVGTIMPRMAMDIDRTIKTSGKIPRKDNLLADSVKHSRVTSRQYIVTAGSDQVRYAAVQEAGIRRGTREFKNYTTAGTGKGWFKGAVEGVTGKLESYIEEAKRSSRL